jgi:hypothetical protein
MRVKLDSGREMNLNPDRYSHIDHGYAVTSHSSQGQTADRVLIHADTDLAAKDLLNNRMAYVAISRGQWDHRFLSMTAAHSRTRLAEMSHTRAHINHSRSLRHLWFGMLPRHRSASSAQV